MHFCDVFLPILIYFSANNLLQRVETFFQFFIQRLRSNRLNRSQINNNRVHRVSFLISFFSFFKDALMLKKKIADLDESFTRVGAAMNYLDLLHRLIRFAATWILIGLIQFGLYMNWLQQQKIGPATLIAVVNYVYGTNIGTLIVYEFLSYVEYVIKYATIERGSIVPKVILLTTILLLLEQN